MAPDIVTLDVEMPVMDGLTTLKAMRNARPTLPVIMFSTLTERGAEATIDALALGASDYVAKPTGAGDYSTAPGANPARHYFPKLRRCVVPSRLPGCAASLVPATCLLP